MVCPWPFLSNMDTVASTVTKPPESGKSFAQALSDSVKFNYISYRPELLWVIQFGFECLKMNMNKELLIASITFVDGSL